MYIRTTEYKLRNFDDCSQINSLCLHLTQALHNLKNEGKIHTNNLKFKFSLVRTLNSK